MKNHPASLFSGTSGGMLLEFVLCFPILVVLFLFLMQFAQIMITSQVVHYAAYMGARSTMTVNNLQRQQYAEKVVKRILAVVSGSPADTSQASGRTSDEYGKLDGWGWLPATKYLDNQVNVNVPLLDVDPYGVKCEVQFKMFLLVPVAGRIISFFADPKKSAEVDWQKKIEDANIAKNPALLSQYANELELEKQTKYPYITLTAVSRVSIPYATKSYPLK